MEEQNQQTCDQYILEQYKKLKAENELALTTNQKLSKRIEALEDRNQSLNDSFKALRMNSKRRILKYDSNYSIHYIIDYTKPDTSNIGTDDMLKMLGFSDADKVENF